MTLGRRTEPAACALYDVANDLAQADEVADDHPDVVARLMQLAAAIRQEIGDIDQPGRGERAAGKVTNPVPLLASPPQP